MKETRNLQPERESQRLDKQSRQPPAAARSDRVVSVGKKREHVEDMVTKMEMMKKTFEKPEWGWKLDGEGEWDGGVGNMGREGEMRKKERNGRNMEGDGVFI
jgi:hypothetical protein